ncbi:hypothetical protein T09_2455 [Trichinella sp. T9]|nr:hypothetical protein T09_2455 [Trichinella sp. T9]
MHKTTTAQVQHPHKYYSWSCDVITPLVHTQKPQNYLDSCVGVFLRCGFAVVFDKKNKQY